MARKDKRELANRLATVIEHLTKLQHSPARAPRDEWMETVTLSRREIRGILRDSPSLRREVLELIAREARDAVDDAAQQLFAPGKQQE